MATENQHRAFISYSRVNKEFASKLAKELREGGVSIWFDLFDIPTGSRWDDEVEQALRECPVFMIILTPSSIVSANVKDEIGYAIDRGKRILPILLEECDVPLRLSRFQYVDFTKKSFEEGIEDAKNLLKKFVDETSDPILETTAVPSNKQSESASTVKTLQKPTPRGLVIGILAVVLLFIAGIGFKFLSNGKNNSNSLLDNPATETRVIPATETSIAATEPPTAIVPKLDFDNGCIDSSSWLLIDGASKSPDSNNCWSLTDWGMNSVKDRGLVFTVKDSNDISSHGILTSINQPLVIIFDVQVNEMSTTSLLDSYIGFGLLPSAISDPKNDGMLYYVAVDKADAPIFIQLKAPGEDKYYLPDPPALKLGQTYKYKLEISGNYLVLYQDSIKIDERSLDEANNYFWVGYTVPNDGSLSAVISNLSIE
jgi:hypothetical protein